MQLLFACQRVKGLPFVCNIEEHLPDPSNICNWLVFKYEPAISLDHILKNESYEQVLDDIRANIPYITAMLVLALEGIHSRGILHNDLKVANTLLLANGQLQINHFGFAESVDAVDVNGDWELRGTPVSMAPELLQGHPRSFASDWFSLGTLIWELVTVTFLYEPNCRRIAEEAESKGLHGTWDVGLQEYMAVAQHEQVMYPKDMDPKLISFLQHLLNKNPQNRWSYPDSMKEIKEHPLFENINFDGILNGQIKSPIKIKAGLF